MELQVKDQITGKLYKALKSGNSAMIEKCFEQTYNQYSSLIFVSISRFVDKKEDCEELTNDVFINFFNHLETIDLNKNIKYYLLVSARNIAINHTTKKVAVETDYVDGENYYSLDNNEFGYTNIIRKLSNILNQEEIDILIKHAVDGYQFNEIARANRKSVNTIKSIYRRAIKKVKERGFKL